MIAGRATGSVFRGDGRDGLARATMTVPLPALADREPQRDRNRHADTHECC